MTFAPDKLKSDLATFINPTIANILVDSYLEMQQRYYAGDWNPSEVNGGKFCEAVARAIYELDTGATTQLSVGDICDQLRSRKGNPPPAHSLQEKDRVHFCQVLQAIYKLRNDRNIAHISVATGHNANMMDATLVVQIVKWLFCEFLRLAQKLDRAEVVLIIESIIQLEHPLIHELDGRPMVMHTGLTVGEEALLLLQHAPQGRLSMAQLREEIPATPQAIAMAVKRYKAPTSRLVRDASDGEIAITPRGQAYVLSSVLPKANGAQEASGRTITRAAATRRKTSHTARKSTIRSEGGRQIKRS